MSEREQETTRSRSRGPSWLATLAGGGLLVLLGFLLGIVVGVSFEDPDLVANTLAGHADEVTLGDMASQTPSEAAAPEPLVPQSLGKQPPEPQPLGARAPAPPPAPRRSAPPPVAAAPPASGAFSVQVGAFRESEPARRLVGHLTGRGFPVFVVGQDPWRVRVGPVASRGEADALARRLKRDEGLPTWVVTDGG